MSQLHTKSFLAKVSLELSQELLTSSNFPKSVKLIIKPKFIKIVFKVPEHCLYELKLFPICLGTTSALRDKKCQGTMKHLHFEPSLLLAQRCILLLGAVHCNANTHLQEGTSVLSVTKVETVQRQQGLGTEQPCLGCQVLQHCPAASFQQ